MLKLYGIVLGAALAALPASAGADIVHLRDGTTVEGSIKRSDDGWRVTQTDGTVREVASDDVLRITLSGSGTPTPLEAEGRLYSLRKSVENASEPATVIDRYERFIAQHEGTKIVDEARKDLAVWKDRLQRGLVRAGDEWMTQAQLARVREASLEKVSEARRLIKDGELKAAEKLVDQVLRVDPDNVSALYLRGLLAFADRKAPAARRSFERVVELLPKHAPTLNNLAVVLWRQNQHVAALNRYDEAMTASPADGQILDNVAEALHALPKNVRKNAAAERVSKRFAEQDADLQQRLAPMGLYRLGSGWVSGDQIEAYLSIQKKVMDQLDVMAADYDESLKHIQGIDRAIAENEQEMDQVADIEYRDERTGLRYRSPRYEALSDENARLVLERDRRKERLEAIRSAARDVKRQLPETPYTGEQRPIGLEGTPLIAPDGQSAVTQPPLATTSAASTHPSSTAP